MPEAPSDRRRTFVPVVLGGLGAGLLATLAGNQPWVVDRSLPARSDPLGQVADAGEMPLAFALGLVVLACWGAALVTRRRVRRAVLALGLFAALGLVATVVVGMVTLDDQVMAAFPEGARRTTDVDPIATTSWFWVAAVAAVACVGTTALATWWAPAWPEMGSRYDAPGAAGAGPDDVPPEERTNLDLWKQLDEGRDPTA